MRTIKIKEALTIIKPEYAFLKLTPNNAVRNNSTYKIARCIAAIYKNVFQRIQLDDRKIKQVFKKEFIIPTKATYKMFEKIGYFIYMEKKKIEFYFVVPKHYVSLIEEKVLDVWGNITIEAVNQLPTFSEQADKYQLIYNKEDALSLKADRRDNDLLRANLNVTNVMEKGDKVGLFYNFIPVTQHTWKSKYKNTIDKVNNHEPVDRNKGKISYLLKYLMLMLSSAVDEVFNVFTEKKEKEKEKDNLFGYLFKKLNDNNSRLLDETFKKENATIVKTQIVAISDSQEKIRKYNNLKSLTQSFETISGDNKLVPKKVNNKIDFTKYMLNGVAINYTSDLECSNFISLAGRDILEEYDFIEKVQTKETQVPEELREGKFFIGENTFRGNKQKAYLSTDKEFQFLSLIIIGPNRSGKSTLMGNLGKNAIDNNEVIVNFDFIGNCELSDEMAAVIGKDKVLNIVCDNDIQMQGMGYNEIEQVEDAFKQYANAKLQTTQLTTLVNSINSGDQPLTTRMERYLQSAANTVFISNGSIKNVFEVLQNHNTRHIFIGKVKQDNLEDMQESLDALLELDEVDKDGIVIGTKYSRIDGIIDRLNKLKANPYMEKMLKKDSTNNFNLVNEFQKCQLINIRMPETMFSTDDEKDVYTTYWMTKIWLALQVRKAKYNRDKMKKVNLFVDELYQVQHTEAFLTSKLSRLPKFNIKPILSCHYLNQIKTIRPELRSANASYMLIAGCDKANFKELESELYPYTEWDLLGLKRHSSLNLVKTKSGYGKFITDMPKPVGSEENKVNQPEMAFNK